MVFFLCPKSLCRARGSHGFSFIFVRRVFCSLSVEVDIDYDDLNFKIPVESPTYREDSDFVIRQMSEILDRRKDVGDNKIIINTNLCKGLLLENIKKSPEISELLRDYR